MRMRRIGSSDLVVSVTGLGCNNFGWRIDADRVNAVVNAAIDSGITFFDTAENYGDWQSEVLLGNALFGRREDVLIATKFGWGRATDADPIPRGSPEYILRAIDASLMRLRTDYVDLYQYHRPDGVTSLVETLGALNDLVDKGKVRYIGSSNLTAQQVREAAQISKERGFASFVSAQNEYSWLQRDAEAELIPACDELDVSLIPYSPLANGLLTGKYKPGEPIPSGTRLEGGLDVDDATWQRISALATFAKSRGLRLLDVAIGGLAGEPSVASVIAGATGPEQVRANAAAAEWEPTPADLVELRSITLAS